jgi:hypothetical protein
MPGEPPTPGSRPPAIGVDTADFFRNAWRTLSLPEKEGRMRLLAMRSGLLSEICKTPWNRPTSSWNSNFLEPGGQVCRGSGSQPGYTRRRRLWLVGVARLQMPRRNMLATRGAPISITGPSKPPRQAAGRLTPSPGPLKGGRPVWFRTGKPPPEPTWGPPLALRP